MAERARGLLKKLPLRGVVQVDRPGIGEQEGQPAERVQRPGRLEDAVTEIRFVEGAPIHVAGSTAGAPAPQPSYSL